MCHIYRDAYLCGHLVYNHTLYCLRGEAAGPSHELETIREISTPCGACISQTAAGMARRETMTTRRERIRRASARFPIAGALLDKFHDAAEKRAVGRDCYVHRDYAIMV